MNNEGPAVMEQSLVAVSNCSKCCVPHVLSLLNLGIHKPVINKVLQREIPGLPDNVAKCCVTSVSETLRHVRERIRFAQIPVDTPTVNRRGSADIVKRPSTALEAPPVVPASVTSLPIADRGRATEPDVIPETATDELNLPSAEDIDDLCEVTPSSASTTIPTGPDRSSYAHLIKPRTKPVEHNSSKSVIEQPKTVIVDQNNNAKTNKHQVDSHTPKEHHRHSSERAQSVGSTREHRRQDRTSMSIIDSPRGRAPPRHYGDQDREPPSSTYTPTAAAMAAEQNRDDRHYQRHEYRDHGQVQHQSYGDWNNRSRGRPPNRRNQPRRPWSGRGEGCRRGFESRRREVKEISEELFERLCERFRRTPDKAPF